MIRFESVPIGEIGDVVTGKTPKTEVIENFGNDYMFIGPTDLHKHFFVISSERMISEKGLRSIKGSVLNGISILVGCIGWDMGNVGVVEGKCATNQQINSITNIRNRYNPLYIYYWLKTKKDFLFQQASVTRTPILNKTSFSEIRVNLPVEKNEQDKIVNFLVAIDKKIALNNHINAELEAMAKTLYDYWFVQFDFPFDFAQGKPAGNGKPYKSFGGKMVYNPILKREIPEEWEATAIGQIATTALGGTPSTEVDEYWENAHIPWLSSAETASFPVISSEQKITQKGIENSAATLLPKGTVVISIVRYIRPSILGIDAATNQSVVGIKECSRLKSSFIFPYFCSEVPRLMGLRTGAQQPHINKGVIDESPIVLPTDYVLEGYYKQVDPIYEQIMTLAFENYKLTELRDWLLPMLMNGQVTVKKSTD